MTRALRPLGIALLLAALLGPAAQAQLNWEAAPTSGTLTLETGFTPDPAAVDLTLTGMDESGMEDCYGYFDAAAPSVDLDFDTDGSLPLKLYVRSSYDTVIAVNDPSGAWHCNDDFDGVQAGVLFDEPMSGNYNIFIGSYSGLMDGEEAPATFYVTELVDAAMLNPYGDATETASLATGFEPDPRAMNVSVGGMDINPEEGCAGFVNAENPTMRLAYDTDGGLPLYIYARSDSDDDLTLTVATPEGAFVCNDDADGLQPGLMIEAPTSGDYAIWVGSFSAMARTEGSGTAQLFVSELEGPTGGYYDEEGYEEYEDYEEMAHEGGEDISLFSTPANGSLDLDPGFTPDPRAVTLRAGGPNTVSVSGCAGAIDNTRPDLNVVYGDGGGVLLFYVEGEADTTMLVNTPSGEWLCSDDEIGLSPLVEIADPEAGLYNIWVGTYSADNAGAEVTLNVSEVDPR